MEPRDSSKQSATGNGQRAETARHAQTTAHDTVDRTARAAHETVDRIASKASQAAASLTDRSGQLREQKDMMMSRARTYVQMHPVASIGIAVAAGFLLSRLLRSDSHDRY